MNAPSDQGRPLYSIPSRPAPRYQSRNPNVVITKPRPGQPKGRTYTTPSVRSRRSRPNDPTDTSRRLETSKGHEILVLFLLSPLHTTTSSSSREHSPPSSHLTIIPSCPPSPTSNSLIHTTHRAAVPRPSSSITKAKMPPCLS